MLDAIAGAKEARVAETEDARDSDEALVTAAQTDAEAFRELYRRYLPRVSAYAAYRVGPRQDTEDVVSEAFLQAASSTTLSPITAAGASARHRACRWRRRRRWRTTTRLRARSLSGQERFEEMRRLVLTLLQQRRKVLLLQFLGLT